MGKENILEENDMGRKKMGDKMMGKDLRKGYGNLRM
jgi:hypothetical protein